MAVIDAQGDVLVVRIVYDGPPKAGKTTSVRALASGLGAAVVAPEEADGRTVYFDWLDYTGGLFEGRRIRCQIVTVPGQATLASRRRHLLQTADAVVFVGDCAPDKLGATRSYFDGLRSVLRSLPGPAVGIVMQANKRDVAGAVPAAGLRAALDESAAQLAIVESVATDGAGIREAFVFAVRLALDRVRELMRSGALTQARPQIDSADELLRQMRGIDGGALALATEGGLKHIHLSELDAAPPAAAAVQQVLNENTQAEVGAAVASMTCERSTDVDVLPRLPDATLPSGMIWPPVRGRMALHDAIGRDVVPSLDGKRGWVARSREWTLHSSTQGGFAELESGRVRLLEWARLHAASESVLSAERCIALAQDGRGGVRLWQAVRRQESLRDLLDRAVAEDAAAVAAALLTVTELFMRAGVAWSGAVCRLPLTLASIGATEAGVAYVGLMPAPDEAAPPVVRGDAETASLLAQELAEWFAAAGATHPEVVAALDLPR